MSRPFWFLITMIALLIAMLGIMAGLIAVPARAASGCGSYELFRAALAKNYKEVPASHGIGGPYLIILFLSPEGSFTIVAKSGNGFACIIAAGRDWESSTPEIPGEKS